MRCEDNHTNHRESALFLLCPTQSLYAAGSSPLSSFFFFFLSLYFCSWFLCWICPPGSLASGEVQIHLKKLGASRIPVIPASESANSPTKVHPHLCNPNHKPSRPAYPLTHANIRAFRKKLSPTSSRGAASSPKPQPSGSLHLRNPDGPSFEACRVERTVLSPSEPCSTRPNPFDDSDISSRKRRRTSLSGASTTLSVGSVDSPQHSPATNYRDGSAMKIDTDPATPRRPLSSNKKDGRRRSARSSRRSARAG